MLIGCGDCEPADSCEFKVLCAVILCQDTPDDTGSYCPGTYNCTGGAAVTSCGAIEPLIDWLNGQMTSFESDSDYPWNTYTTGFFTNGASSPYSITGPGGSTGYGAPSFGSGYTISYALTALNGSSFGDVCAFAQIAAMRMSGNLFITPLGVSGVTESCLATAADGICSASGQVGSGTYYIPMPPYDLCSDPSGGGFQIEYEFYQTGNSEDCLPGFSGAHAQCETPDPFFGDDPP